MKEFINKTKQKDLIHYDFKLLDPTVENYTKYYDYGLNLFMGASNRMFKLIFDSTIKELRKRGKATPDEILKEKFSVPKRFFKVLKTSVTKSVKDVKEEVKRDKIIVITWEIKGALFEKIDNVWIITINIGGRAKDER